MNTLFIIISLVCTLLLLFAAIWFINRKNRPKISRTEERKAEVEKPEINEIDDPLN